MEVEKTATMFFRCFCIALAFFFVVFGAVFLFLSVHVLEAPYILLTDPQRLGKELGPVAIRWNGKEKNCRVYTSKCLVCGSKGNYRQVPCLLIYPPFSLFRFSYGHALKITEDSVGIFNDGLTECLPMGKRIYESDMTYPVISVGDSMKGWDAKYEITREKTGIRYRIYPSKYSDRDIEFTIPLSYLKSLPET